MTLTQHRLSHARKLSCIGLAVFACSASLASEAGVARAATGDRIYLGTVDDNNHLAQQIDSSLADHDYARFSGSVPHARMISVKAGATWRQVANAHSGTAVYSNIVRWANTLKGRQGPIFLAFHHEPEVRSNSRFGSAQDYKAAYRRVVTIFRNHGVHNVKFTWQMTGWAFRTNQWARDDAP